MVKTLASMVNSWPKDTFVGTPKRRQGFVTGLHTSHLNFDEKVLIYVANYYEQLLMHWRGSNHIDSNMVRR